MCVNNQVDEKHINLFKKASTFKTKSFNHNNGAFKPHPLTTIIISQLVGFERNQHRYIHGKWDVYMFRMEIHQHYHHYITRRIAL